MDWFPRRAPLLMPSEVGVLVVEKHSYLRCHECITPDTTVKKKPRQLSLPSENWASVAE